MKSTWQARAYRIYDFLGPMLLILIGMGLLVVMAAATLALAIRLGYFREPITRAPPGPWRKAEERREEVEWREADEANPADDSTGPTRLRRPGTPS